MSNFKDFKKTGEKYGAGDSMYMKLEDGDNKVRIVSDFIEYGNHFVKAENRSYLCVGQDGDCQYCNSGNKPKFQSIGWVINRKTGKPQLLKLGWMAYQEIGKLAVSEDYGFEGVPPYDITINKTGAGLDTKYSVLAARKNTELTATDNKLVGELKPIEDVFEDMKNKALGNDTEIHLDDEEGK